MRYEYSLTDKGRKTLHDSKEKDLIPQGLEEIVIRVASTFGHVALNDLVDEAYRRYNKRDNSSHQQ